MIDHDHRQAAALFVDFDNLFYGLLNSLYQRVHKRALDESLNVLAALRRRLHEDGTAVVVGRAYSSFDEYPGSEAAHDLSLMGYHPQYVVSHKGKNSADLQLSIDLLEVLLSRSDIHTFVIVGGDRDFLPIARKVLEARRDLLICSLPEMTSGDLIDRVGAERFLDATQLVSRGEPTAAAGAPLAPDAGPPVVADAGPPVVADAGPPVVAVPVAGTAPAVAARPSGPRILGFVQLPQARHWTPLSDEEALSLQRQERCLRLLNDLARRFATAGGKAEVWLSPFLKNEMADHFSDLTHPQRRRLVNLLKEQGKIAVEERESQTGPFPYSVVLLNREHPDVAKLT